MSGSNYLFLSKDIKISANSQDYLYIPISTGTTWQIKKIGANTDIDNIKLEFLYSENWGESFFNPYFVDSEKIISAYLKGGVISEKNFSDGFVFMGGDRTLFYIKLHNNSNIEANICCWLEGIITWYKIHLLGVEKQTET